ncbi:uncharacterized protein LOC123559675 [Mercenaria mercenaria]|uniref:uncharacterized protein LOC123559675 n=1 Tax=Mercenaria mercenaria TaxID=6596 RepID=UPI00234EEE5E|nr:uncharacterized protein LOC123559675 [Mercenaria mercenaria]
MLHLLLPLTQKIQTLYWNGSEQIKETHGQHFLYKYKFTQYYQEGTYYLTLTDTVSGDDEIYYRVHYYNESVHCLMETARLALRDISNNLCGFVYLRTTKAIEEENVNLEYYPSKNVMDDPEKFARQWTLSTNGTSIPVEMTTGVYKEEAKPNDKYLLTIFMVSDSMTGEYFVNCGETAGYSNMVEVMILVPPRAPAFEGLKDIDDCKGCIVGKDGEQFSVLCKTSGGTQPIKVTMSIGNESLSPQRYNETEGYMAFFTLYDRHHMAIITCAVMNDALTSPLIITARVYVIKSPTFQLFAVPELLKEDETVKITCVLKSGRPAPKVFFNISGTDVSSADQTHNFNSSTYLVHLTIFKRIWNRENIRCCRFNEWYKKASECSEPKHVTYLFPPSKLNLQVRFEEHSHEMYAVCTVYDSNPACEAKFSASSGIIASDRYNRNISRHHRAWDTEHAVNLNVSKNDNGEVISCKAYCQEFPDDLKDTKIITLPYSPIIEFNISGSVLNISEGEQAHVKCSAESIPVSNISWVEQTDVGNITMKQCHLQADCAIVIDVHPISQRHFICKTHYLQTTKQKTLTVNIFEKDEQRYNNQENPVSNDKSFIWIILGSCLSVIVVALIVYLIARKQLSNSKAKQEVNRVRNSEGGDEARETEDEPEVHLQEYLNDTSCGQSEVIYAQPDKIKRKPSVNATYSETDKTGNQSYLASCSKETKPAQDGHLLYVDLDFDSTGAPPKSTIAKRRNSPTEYVAIDFVKTAAGKTGESELPEMETIYANQ